MTQCIEDASRAEARRTARRCRGALGGAGKRAAEAVQKAVACGEPLAAIEEAGAFFEAFSPLAQRASFEKLAYLRVWWPDGRPK